MKYVRCDSHCKFPAYDKEEVDNLFYKKENILVYTTTGTVTENVNNPYNWEDMMGFEFTFDLPEGYNYKNCIVINSSFSSDDESNQYGSYKASLVQVVYTELKTIESDGMVSNKVCGVFIANADVDTVGTTYTVKVVVMKVD